MLPFAGSFGAAAVAGPQTISFVSALQRQSSDAARMLQTIAKEPDSPATLAQVRNAARFG
jgi:hypothetical protein